MTSLTRLVKGSWVKGLWGKGSVWPLLALAYGTVFLFILFLAYTGNIPTWLTQIPYYDKIGHVALYAIATYLGHRVLRGRSIVLPGIRRLPLFPTLFGLWTVTEELLQGFAANRTLDATDLVCSVIGVTLGWWLVEQTGERKKAKAKG
jgi:polysaccharide biosynthesis protein VpsQ